MKKQLLITFCTLAPFIMDAQTFSILHSFGPAASGAGNSHTNSDGALPYSQLIQGSNGKLYGGTMWGGTNGTGYGVIFSVDTDGSNFAVLYNMSPSGGYFSDAEGLSGAHPSPQSLFQGNDGALYGCGFYGGDGDANGTVFKLNTNGTGFTVLKNFDDVNYLLDNPVGLIQGDDGNFYGVAEGGQANGGVFRLDTNGFNFSGLLPFTNSNIGASPGAGLIQGKDGRLYGASTQGGTNISYFSDGSHAGGGTIYSLNTDGSEARVLHEFDAPFPWQLAPNGFAPNWRLLQGNDGWLYGTTSQGGTNDAGVLFRLKTDGTGYSVIHFFDTRGTQIPLIQGSDGKLYGTIGGGTFGSGILYSINTDGTGFTTILDFGSANIGAPVSLIQGTDGKLYGTMQGGGDNGIVFSLTLPNPPPQISGGSIDIQSGNFSFVITGITNQTIIVEASTNLMNWQPLWTSTLLTTSTNFIDPQWKNYSTRYYRVQSI